MTYQLIAYLDQDRRRVVENPRQATARLWATPVHCHIVDHSPTRADRVVGLLGGLNLAICVTS